VHPLDDNLSGESNWRSALADLNGDGLLDLATVFDNPNGVRWYENLSHDCNGNGRPDGQDLQSGLDLDCNANGVPDTCDLSSEASIDCNGNRVPDECEGCTGPACDADSDGCHDAVDANPSDPTTCGDSDSDLCDDCASGVFAPAADGPDEDADGSCDTGDCSTSSTAWSEPGPVEGLSVGRIGLSWQPPFLPGGTSLTYDTLRSPAPSDFLGVVATCLETGDDDTSAVDQVKPPAGGLFSYLVRPSNACGAGSLGTDSGGVEREAMVCP
jgi:hypothetical protein